jgi:LysR family transcriptional activator of nhaA
MPAAYRVEPFASKTFIWRLCSAEENDPMDPLNYHHLRYFWAVARDGKLTSTARRLRVSASALSAQIRQLEDTLGEPLFLREGRRLVLTEAGRIAFDHAERVFAAGAELVSTLGEGRRASDLLRVGAVATLSRNFQESFLEPLFQQPGVRLRLVSGGPEDLLARLAALELDLVLANHPPPGSRPGLKARRLARQPASLVGRPGRAPIRTPEDLSDVPLLLPSPDSEVRTEFDAWCERGRVQVRILAEVDDMAMLRLLVRATDALALLPSVVVRDELQSGVLREHFVFTDLYESFYAVIADRRYHHPLVEPLLDRDEAAILAMTAG